MGDSASRDGVSRESLMDEVVFDIFCDGAWGSEE